MSLLTWVYEELHKIAITCWEFFKDCNWFKDWNYNWKLLQYSKCIIQIQARDSNCINQL